MRQTSHNASPYNKNVHTVTKWCIVGNRNSALWDLCLYWLHYKDAITSYENVYDILASATFFACYAVLANNSLLIKQQILAFTRHNSRHFPEWQFQLNCPDLVINCQHRFSSFYGDKCSRARNKYIMRCITEIIVKDSFRQIFMEFTFKYDKFSYLWLSAWLCYFQLKHTEDTSVLH